MVEITGGAMKIYGFFNSDTEYGDAVAIAIAEDGNVIASHVSSSESWAKHDLGMDGRSTWKHEAYAEAYPDGYGLEFVTIRSNRDAHEGLQKAFANNRAQIAGAPED